CDAVLIPGDLWDSPRPHSNEIRVIREAVVRVAQFIPVICIAGNHDVSTNAQDASALECLKDLPNVYVFDSPGQMSIVLSGQLVQFFCLPYPRKSQLVTYDVNKDKSSEELTAIVNQALTSILRGFRVEFQPGIPHILLAHGSVANCKVNDQPRSLATDILLPLDELAAFDFTALGHIHQQQPLNDAGTIWYSGSLTRGGFGEEKEPKGFNLIGLAPGEPAQVTFVRNPHARVYRTLKAVDIDDALLAAPLDPSIVWRCKDSMTAEDYQRLKPILDVLQAATPFFQLDVEILSEDRTRDAGMATMLTMDHALRRALAITVEDTELPSLFEKHRALVQEVAG
ncbi:MAG: metallophosphoesterase, partial [Nitrospira sp.]